MFDKPVEAVIFDMDGLLIDSEIVYIEAMTAAARAMGREMSIDFCHSMIGKPGPMCGVMIQDHFGPSFALDRFDAGVDEFVARRMAAGVPVKPGAPEILAFLQARGLPLGLATSSSTRTVQRHLGATGLLGHFKAIATRNDVVNGKPHPDLYLEAARRLEVPPAHCIALEDSNTGLTAAHAAGTMPIMVPDILPPTDEVRAKCLTVVADLHAALDLLRRALRGG